MTFLIHLALFYCYYSVGPELSIPALMFILHSFMWSICCTWFLFVVKHFEMPQLYEMCCTNKMYDYYSLVSVHNNNKLLHRSKRGKYVSLYTRGIKVQAPLKQMFLIDVCELILCLMNVNNIFFRTNENIDSRCRRHCVQIMQQGPQ